MLNDTRLGDLSSGIYDAAEHPLSRKIVGDDAAGIDAFETASFVHAADAHEIPPRNAVLRAEHHRVATIHRGKITDDGCDLMCLHPKDNEILFGDLRYLVRRSNA